MRKVLTTAATFNPLEVDLIKLRPELRIATTTDDPILAGCIRSAIAACENYTNNVLCQSTWTLYFDGFEAEMETPAPLVSVTSIKYLDSSGVEQTLSTDYYKASTSHNPINGLITLKSGQSWPSTYDEADAVYIECVIGYANPNAIPPDVIDGLVAKVQELYYGVDMSAKYQDCWENYRRIPI